MIEFRENWELEKTCGEPLRSCKTIKPTSTSLGFLIGDPGFRSNQYDKNLKHFYMRRKRGTR